MNLTIHATEILPFISSDDGKLTTFNVQSIFCGFGQTKSFWNEKYLSVLFKFMFHKWNDLCQFKWTFVLSNIHKLFGFEENFFYFRSIIFSHWSQKKNCWFKILNKVSLWNSNGEMERQFVSDQNDFVSI